MERVVTWMMVPGLILMALVATAYLSREPK